MFSKGESVTFTDQGVERHGVIDVAGSKQVSVFCIHSGVVKRSMVPIEQIRYSSQPVPALLKTTAVKTVSFKKNDRVVFTKDGATHQGFVSKLKGAKLEVSFLKDGDKVCVVGHSSLFKLSQDALPKCEPSLLDGYCILIFSPYI